MAFVPRAKLNTSDYSV